MKIRIPQRRHGRRGFSLAELMVVVVIIGLLATLVVPNVLSRLMAANRQKAKSDIVVIETAIKSYVMENNGRYPESLLELVTPDATGNTYLDRESIPRDPWGNEYIYEPPQRGSMRFRIISYGKDGAPGGEGDDADIDNMMIKEGQI